MANSTQDKKPETREEKIALIKKRLTSIRMLTFVERSKGHVEYWDNRELDNALDDLEE